MAAPRTRVSGPDRDLNVQELAFEPVRTYSQQVLRRFVRHRAALAAAGVLVLIALSAVFAPEIAPYPMGVPDYSAMLAPPSLRHLMGTDPIGIDVFTEVLYGGRISLTIGLFAALLAIVVGGLVGSVSGYFGGWVDVILMRIT